MAPALGDAIWIVLQIAIWLVIARFILDWVRLLARQWHPRGVVAVIAEAIYTVTDPPLRAVRRIIPPVRLGQVMLDLSPMLLLIGLVILQAVLPRLFY